MTFLLSQKGFLFLGGQREASRAEECERLTSNVSPSFGLALACFKARVNLVNNVYAASAAYNATIFVSNFHGF